MGIFTYKRLYQAPPVRTLWGMKTPALLLSALLLAGCTAPASSPTLTAPSNSAPSAAAATPSPTPTPTKTRDLGNLPIGDHVTWTADDGTQIGTMAMLAGKYTRSPYRDKPLYAAKVRVCATGQKWPDVSSTGWFVETADGDQYQAADDQGDGDPVPMFPLFSRTVNKGKCVQGWIPFEIGKSTKVSHVGFQADEGGQVVYWKV